MDYAVNFCSILRVCGLHPTSYPNCQNNPDVFLFSLSNRRMYSDSRLECYNVPSYYLKHNANAHVLATPYGSPLERAKAVTILLSKRLAICCRFIPGNRNYQHT